MRSSLESWLQGHSSRAINARSRYYAGQLSYDVILRDGDEVGVGKAPSLMVAFHRAKFRLSKPKETA